MELKRIQHSQSNLEKRGKKKKQFLRAFTTGFQGNILYYKIYLLPNCKTYNKITLILVTQYQEKDRQIGQWNKIESQEKMQFSGETVFTINGAETSLYNK